MVSEPKRIVVDDGTFGANTQENIGFGPGTGDIIRRLTNYHNIWWGFSCEPQNADVNAQGVWVLWMKPDVTQADVVWNNTNINANDFNQMIIACGIWGASNQTPFVFSSQLKSSRNIVANMELRLSIRVTGVTSGSVAIKSIMCAGLSVK